MYTGIILAGGKSSRMGEDKGLMLLNGKPMIQYVIDAVSKLTDKIIIVSNSSKYEQFGCKVIPDVVKDKGPLGGIISGLEQTTSERNWILSCDTPYISVEILRELMETMGEEQIRITSAGDKIHPLIGTYRKSALIPLKEQLALNELKLTKAFEGVEKTIFDANHYPLNCFKNLNKKEDL